MYLWGNGRYGQLAGVGTNLMIPTLAPSLLQTQQVDPKLPPRTCFLLGVCFLLIYLLFSLPLCVSFWGVWSRLCADRIVPSCCSPTGRFWLWARASTADWARGILMTSISPPSSLPFKVSCFLCFWLLYCVLTEHRVLLKITLDKTGVCCRLRGGSAGDFLWV